MTGSARCRALPPQRLSGARQPVSLLADQRGSVLEKLLLICVITGILAGGLAIFGQRIRASLTCQGAVIANADGSYACGKGGATPQGGAAPTGGNAPVALNNVPRPTSCTRGGVGCMCFVAGTPVATSVGLLAIENVVPGMLVLSRPENGGDIQWKPVVQTFVSRSRALYHLTFTDQHGQSETLTTTGNHPFYVAGQGWAEARSLVPGRDQLVDGQGRTVDLQRSEVTDDHLPVYNFEVADDHTYFVGRLQLWVHNRTIIIGDQVDLPLPDGDTIIGRVARRNHNGTFQVLGELPDGQMYVTTVDQNGRPLTPSHALAQPSRPLPPLPEPQQPQVVPLRPRPLPPRPLPRPPLAQPPRPLPQPPLAQPQQPQRPLPEQPPPAYEDPPSQTFEEWSRTNGEPADPNEQPPGYSVFPPAPVANGGQLPLPAAPGLPPPPGLEGPRRQVMTVDGTFDQILMNGDWVTVGPSAHQPLPAATAAPEPEPAPDPFPGNWTADVQPEPLSWVAQRVLRRHGNPIGRRVRLTLPGPPPENVVAEVVARNPDRTYGIRWETANGVFTGVVDPQGQIIIQDNPPRTPAAQPSTGAAPTASNSGNTGGTPPPANDNGSAHDNGSAPDHQTAHEALDAPIATLTFMVQIGHDNAIDTFRTQRTGHSFINLHFENPANIPARWEDEYPQHYALLRADRYYVGAFQRVRPNEVQLFRTVPGQVRVEHDGYWNNTSSVLQAAGGQSYNLTVEQVEQVLNYVNRTELGNFNVCTRNCTDWAAGAVQASGNRPPSARYAGLNVPAVAFQSIRRAEAAGLDGAQTRPLITQPLMTGSGPYAVQRRDRFGPLTRVVVEIPEDAPEITRPPATAYGFDDEEHLGYRPPTPIPAIEETHPDRTGSGVFGDEFDEPAPANNNANLPPAGGPVTVPTIVPNQDSTSLPSSECG